MFVVVLLHQGTQVREKGFKPAGWGPAIGPPLFALTRGDSRLENLSDFYDHSTFKSTMIGLWLEFKSTQKRELEKYDINFWWETPRAAAAAASGGGYSRRITA